MADLLFVLVVAVFFAVAVLYVRACGALAPAGPLTADPDPDPESETEAVVA